MLAVQHEVAKVNKKDLEKSNDDSAARSRESYLKNPEKSHAGNCKSYMKDAEKSAARSRKSYNIGVGSKS